MAISTIGTNGLDQTSNIELGATGNVGIGTASPAKKLDVNGDALISGLTVGKGGSAVAGQTAVGQSALSSNTSGNTNSAFGYLTLTSNTTGSGNSGFGQQSLQANTSGSYNSAYGLYTLIQNTTGGYNTAFGVQALQANTTANSNTAVGHQAGYSNTVGNYNTFIGHQSGYSLNGSSGNYFNTCVGHASGFNLTTGYQNTFVGAANNIGASGYLVTTGSKNTILGAYSGNQGGLDIRTASNYIVLSDGDGNPQVSTYNGGSVALQGATPKAGTGITFPASQSASSDANTLDDYEEGTWTPVVGDGTYTYSYGPTGKYIKIGKLVYAYFGFMVGTATPGTNNGVIGGLPFNSVNYGGYQEYGTVAFGGGFVTAALSYAGMWFLPGGTNAYIRNISTNSDSPVTSNNVWKAGTFIRGTFIYITDN